MGERTEHFGGTKIETDPEKLEFLKKEKDRLLQEFILNDWPNELVGVQSFILDTQGYSTFKDIEPVKNIHEKVQWLGERAKTNQRQDGTSNDVTKNRILLNELLERPDIPLDPEQETLVEKINALTAEMNAITRKYTDQEGSDEETIKSEFKDILNQLLPLIGKKPLE